MSKRVSVKVIHKHDRQEPLDDIKNLQKLASQASNRAVREALKAGVAISYIENGRLVQRNADKEIVELKKLESKPRLNLDEFLCQA